RNRTIYVGIKGAVECPIRIESRDGIASLTTNTGESAGDENLAVGLHGNGIDKIIRVEIRKRAVKSAIGVEPRDVVSCLTGDGKEGATEDDLAIGLHGDSRNKIVGVWVKAVERRLTARRWWNTN